jgi:PAS domain S-box-containing protein
MAGDIEPVEYYENTLLTKEGEERLIAFHNTVIRDKNSHTVGVLFSGEDITERKQAEEALQHRVEFEGLITALSTHFIDLASDEIDDGINQALQTIGDFIGVDRSYVVMFPEDGTKMDNTHEWCKEGIEPQIDNLKGLSVEDLSWLMDKLNRFENVYISRVADHPPEASAEKEILQSQDIQSLIIVPMIYGRSLIGYLGFDSVRTEKRWPEDSITLLKIVGEIFANALEHKQADDEIEQSRAFLAAIIENITDPIYIKDRQFRFTEVNNAFLHRYNVAKEEIIGETRFRETDAEIFKTGRKLELHEQHYADAEGNPHWTDVKKVPLTDESGEITHVLTISRDITERKQAEEARRKSEELFRAIFETAQDSIFIKDRALNYIQVNPAMENLFGLPASKLIELTEDDLFGEEAGAHIREVDSRVLGG